ncbi:hypothetical protein [Fibrobacter sp.]|uniref:hypothetical protein n=1 Tax=Fibrobacter sp. TaxID=35828 RepID=UPI00388E76EF
MKKIISLVCCLLATMVMAEDDLAKIQKSDSNLVRVAISEIKIPSEVLKHLANKAGDEKNTFAAEIEYKGVTKLRTKGLPYNGGAQEKFSFSEVDSTQQLLLLAPEDEYRVKCFFTEENLVKDPITSCVVGASIGMGVMIVAGICIAVAGVLTVTTAGVATPIAAPVIIASAAVVGGGIGLAAGAGVAKLKSDQMVPIAEFVVKGENFFGVHKSEEIIVEDVLINKKIGSLTIVGERAQTVQEDGSLELRKGYIVRLRSVYFSTGDSADTSSNEYHLTIRCGEDKIDRKLGKVRVNTEWALGEEALFYFENWGGETELKIYQDRPWAPDKLVFDKKMQAFGDGKSWLFNGQVKDENSYVIFETFSTEKK